jgi:hypothetical protein
MNLESHVHVYYSRWLPPVGMMRLSVSRKLHEAWPVPLTRASERLLISVSIKSVALNSRYAVYFCLLHKL